jgi:hypothetical protein
MNAREDLLRPAHVETPLGQHALPLRRVTRDAHKLNVATLNCGVKRPRDTEALTMCPECTNGNWRVIFRFVGQDVELGDYLDYH